MDRSVRAARAEQAGREEQRVPRQEEPDEQSGLREQDGGHAEGAEGGEEGARVQDVHRLGGGEGVYGHGGRSSLSRLIMG